MQERRQSAGQPPTAGEQHALPRTQILPPLDEILPAERPTEAAPASPAPLAPAHPEAAPVEPAHDRAAAAPVPPQPDVAAEGLADSAPASEEAPDVSSVQAQPPTPVQPDLEELILAPASSGGLLSPGTTLQWGEQAFVLGDALPRGWYRAESRAGEPVLLRPGVWTGWDHLPAHRLLPRPLYAGELGIALPWIEGRSLQTGSPLAEAVPLVLSLAQLVRFCEAQGYAVIDLDPEHLVLTDQGLLLRLPPRLAALGSPLPALYRPGLTPPEVAMQAPATGREGVWLLGGLLYWLLTGQGLPEEGVERSLLTSIAVPGLPQLLRQALTDPAHRCSPQAFSEGLRALITSRPPVLRVGAATSIGLNPDRPANEDSYGYLWQAVESHEERMHLLRAIVSDGMGGMAAGEVASRAAVQGFLAGPPPAGLTDPEVQAAWAVHLAWQANAAVLDALAGEDGGCTLSSVVFSGARYALAHVGDSRAYRYGPAGLVQISKDHSLVAALVASGVITAQQAESHPERNKVLRSLGSLRQEQIGYVSDLSETLGSRTAELAVGESLILVTDGVWGEVDARAFLDVVEREQADPQAVADQLVQAALQAGAPDNATALVIRRDR